MPLPANVHSLMLGEAGVQLIKKHAHRLGAEKKVPGCKGRCLQSAWARASWFGWGFLRGVCEAGGM